MRWSFGRVILYVLCASACVAYAEDQDDGSPNATDYNHPHEWLTAATFVNDGATLMAFGVIIAGGGSGAYVVLGRQAMVLRSIHCIDAPVSITYHPMRWAMNGDERVGAVVGNAAVCAGLWLAVAFLHCAPCLKAEKGAKEGGRDVRLAAAAAGFSWVLGPCTVQLAIELLREGTDSVPVGIALFVVLVALGCALRRTSVAAAQASFQSAEPALHSGAFARCDAVSRFAFGTTLWQRSTAAERPPLSAVLRPTETEMLKAYAEFPSVRGAYLLLESVHVYLIAILLGLWSEDTCLQRAIAVAAIVAVHMLTFLVIDAFGATFANLLSLFTAVCTVFGSLLLTAAYDGTVPKESHGGGHILLLVASCGSVLWVCWDLAFTVFDRIASRGSSDACYLRRKPSVRSHAIFIPGSVSSSLHRGASVSSRGGESPRALLHYAHRPDRAASCPQMGAGNLSSVDAADVFANSASVACNPAAGGVAAHGALLLSSSLATNDSPKAGPRRTEAGFDLAQYQAAKPNLNEAARLAVAKGRPAAPPPYAPPPAAAGGNPGCTTPKTPASSCGSAQLLAQRAASPPSRPAEGPSDGTRDFCAGKKAAGCTLTAAGRCVEAPSDEEDTPCPSENASAADIRCLLSQVRKQMKPGPAGAEPPKRAPGGVLRGRGLGGAGEGLHCELAASFGGNWTLHSCEGSGRSRAVCGTILRSPKLRRAAVGAGCAKPANYASSASTPSDPASTTLSGVSGAGQDSFALTEDSKPSTPHAGLQTTVLHAPRRKSNPLHAGAPTLQSSVRVKSDQSSGPLFGSMSHSVDGRADFPLCRSPLMASRSVS
ncbi:hypothetical protein DIPPA_23788 [Diplonema papillatum]|nr:hypothetical protein DIPPA_23788 [Diplonema papillatum]